MSKISRLKYVFVAAVLLVLSTKTYAVDTNTLQPISQKTVCDNVNKPSTEKVTAVITDVMLTGFRGWVSLDGTYQDIMVTTLGVRRVAKNFDNSNLERVRTNYNQNNLTDRKYESDAYSMTLKLPARIEGVKHVYDATLTLADGVKFELTCRSDYLL